MILKCEVCGANIEFDGSTSIATCKYCDSKMIVSKNKDKIENLFNRATFLRQNLDFDGAISVFDDLLREDYKDAAAHWGMVLSKYGIEYVNDIGGEMKPTCHRIQDHSIFDDADYRAAQQNADVYESYVFQEEAARIDEIYNKYIKIVKEERPYDVFICYKDKTENGEPTEDSMIAYNIYNSLEQAGYRTFFAKKSLESKLGQEYEPYIYAALMSATVMIVLGTKTEYYTSTWVKNEWSRFLELKKENKNKMLIACFKNMSPYEMPMEFSAFQSFDLNKIGYVEYLVEGVNNIIQNGKRNGENAKSKEMSEVDRLSANAETFLKLNENPKAYELYIEMQNKYPEDYRGWWGVPYIQSDCLKKLDIELASELDNMVQHAINLADSDKAKRIQEEWREYLKKIQEQDTRLEIRKAEEEREYYQKLIDEYEDVSSEIDHKKEQFSILQSNLNEIETKMNKLSSWITVFVAGIGEMIIFCIFLTLATLASEMGIIDKELEYGLIAVGIIWVLFGIRRGSKLLILDIPYQKELKKYNALKLQQQEIGTYIDELENRREAYEMNKNKVKELDDFIQRKRD